jgi:hypothetical protein
MHLKTEEQNKIKECTEKNFLNVLIAIFHSGVFDATIIRENPRTRLRG